MLKKNHVALIFLIVAIIVDYAYGIYTRQLSQAFEMSTLSTLIRMRPVFFVLFYGLLCWAASRTSGKLSPLLLAGILIVLLFAALPRFNLFITFGWRFPQIVEHYVVAISNSQLALAMNTGGLILGFGLFQHLTSFKQ